MARWTYLAALVWGLSPGLPALEDPDLAVESVAAMVLTLEGESSLEQGGPLALGQLLGPGDRLRTGTDGRLHLLLADGSSLSLAPDSELWLQALGNRDRGSATRVHLKRGLLNGLVERLPPGGSFEVHSDNALVAVTGTDFEVQTRAQETVVTVNEGTVTLGDPGRKRQEPVLPLRRRRLMHNRLLAEERLPKREIGAYRERWARARVFHAQRRELEKHFKVQEAKERARWRRELLKRRATSPRPR